MNPLTVLVSQNQRRGQRLEYSKFVNLFTFVALALPSSGRAREENLKISQTLTTQNSSLHGISEYELTATAIGQSVLLERLKQLLRLRIFNSLGKGCNLGPKICLDCRDLGRFPVAGRA